MNQFEFEATFADDRIVEILCKDLNRNGCFLITEQFVENPHLEEFIFTVRADVIPETKFSDYCWAVARQLMTSLDTWFPHMGHKVDLLEWKYTEDNFYDCKILVAIYPIDPNKKQYKPVHSKRLYDVSGGGKNA